MEPVAIKPLENVTDARLLTSQKESFSYGLVKYGIPITKSNFKYGGGSTTIYTIPEGKLFFMTAVTLTAFSTAANDAPFYIQSYNNGKILYIQLTTGSVTEQAEEKVLSFTQPILFYQNDVISVVSGSAAGEATGIIYGYEIDASMKDQFI